MDQTFLLLFSCSVAFILGYGVREMISQHRRREARKAHDEREARKTRLLMMAAERVEAINLVPTSSDRPR
jgi:hypothetical protein